MYRFRLFGSPHLAALGLTVLLSAALVWAGRSRRLAGQQRRLSLYLALLLLLNELTWQGYLIYHSAWSLTDHLPFHLCDAAVVVSIAALVTQRQRLFELAYFWGLGGSVQALLTPGLTLPFPTYEFCRYFISHSGIVLVVAYLAFGRGLRPGRGAAWRTILITTAYAVAVGALNRVIGANYMFLCGTPGTPSLLDWLAPWPWYLLPLAGIGSGVMLLLDLPYYLADRRRRKVAAP